MTTDMKAMHERIVNEAMEAAMEFGSCCALKVSQASIGPAFTSYQDTKRVLLRALADVRDRMEDRTADALPVRLCPPVSYGGAEFESLLEGEDRTHNAGVAGSSPAPAIERERAQVVNPERVRGLRAFLFRTFALLARPYDRISDRTAGAEVSDGAA